MSRFALIDADGAFTGRILEFEEAPELAPNKGQWVALSSLTEDATGRVAGMRTAKLAEVKAEASRRIVSLYPEWRQLNMIARGVELTRIAGERAWTTEEQAEADALQSAWDGIKAIRARSDELEATVPEDAAGIVAFDVSQGWD